MTETISRLKEALGESNVLFNEPMSSHTTFRIGGNADIFVTPQGAESVCKAVEIAKESGLPYYIMGNGSNLLVKDKGFRGIIIQIYKGLSHIEVKDDIIVAGAGTLLSAAARKALEASLTGMECLSGIPGTVGGAVCMNAGAYGGEIKDVAISSKVLVNGAVETIDNKASEFGYRTSRIMREHMIVLEASFGLEKGDRDEIRNKMQELAHQRNTKQPVELPSAGSTFKRPEGYFAGKLIDDSGLRGCSVGRAQVSPKHCGFIVNNGGATAGEVLELIDHVRKTVYDRFGVMLEPEVRIIGE